MKIKKDDTVIVLTEKTKGRTGKVLKALPKKTSNRRGINMQTKHQKQTQKVAAEIFKEGPIDVSNVMYYDTKAKKPRESDTRLMPSKKVKIAKATGQNEAERRRF